MPNLAEAIEESNTVVPTTYRIIDSNMDLLYSEVEKLNRKAVMFECPTVEVVVHNTEQAPDLEIHERLRRQKGSALTDDEIKTIPLVNFHYVEIVGEGPKLGDFKFIGTLDHRTIPGQVIVNTVPGESIPQPFYTSEPICEHCWKKRKRNETFVLEGVEGDEKYHTQVGRNCLRDFLGHDPMAIARHLSALFAFMERLSTRDRNSGGRIDYFYNSKMVLEFTYAVIQAFGWVPRSQGGDAETTSDIVGLLLNSPYNTYMEEKRQKIFEQIKEHREDAGKEADDAISWLKTQEGTNEYIHNLKLLEKEKVIPIKMLGYWCSLIAAYQRDLDRLKIAKKEKRVSEHVGEIKQRIKMVVKCKKLRYINGAFGTVCIHNMLDDKGRTIMWFANTDAKMVVGEHYKITATIKKHDEFNDWKQTVVTRVTVNEQIKTKEK